MLQAQVKVLMPHCGTAWHSHSD